MLLPCAASKGVCRNVLQQLMGFLNNLLSREDSACLWQEWGSWAPKRITGSAASAARAADVASHRLKHHLNRYLMPDGAHQQVYLHPYPKELMLRNHV